VSKNIGEFIQQHERNAQKNIHGYPTKFISELLELTTNLNKEKKKWKKLAQDRGHVLDKISSIMNVAGVLNIIKGEETNDRLE